MKRTPLPLPARWRRRALMAVRADACQLCTTVLAALAAAGCAIPATDVQVPTMSMHAALERARAEPPIVTDLRPVLTRADFVRPQQDQPQTLLSAPQVRLAYLYEWIDTEGNKHFGEWVAIPIGGYDWIMNDGSRARLDGASHDTPFAPEGH